MILLVTVFLIHHTLWVDSHPFTKRSLLWNPIYCQTFPHKDTPTQPPPPPTSYESSRAILDFMVFLLHLLVQQRKKEIKYSLGEEKCTTGLFCENYDVRSSSVLIFIVLVAVSAKVYLQFSGICTLLNLYCSVYDTKDCSCILTLKSYYLLLHILVTILFYILEYFNTYFI